MARRERAHAIDRISPEYANARARLFARLEAAGRRLGDFPELGRPGQQPGTRELVVSDTGYLLVYRKRAGRVEILSVQPTYRTR